MSSAPERVLRVLFLCTGNSARSQMAEALLTRKGGSRFIVASAGSQPADRVNPLAVETLDHAGIPWHGRTPKSIDAVMADDWDIIVTVCDRAREACPVFPGRPMTAHWGMPDPAEVEGEDKVKGRAFEDAFTLINRRIDLFLALPFDKLERLALTTRLKAIGEG
jgi:protein-tyrosine-phosphatase